MRYSHRFFLYAPVGVILLLAAAVSAYWFTASNTFTSRLARLNGHQLAPGITISYAAAQTGGFPFRLDAVLRDLQVQIQTAHGPVRWTSEHFALHGFDYGAMHILFEAAGRQHLSWYDRNGARHAIAFTPALLRASVLGQGGRIGRLDVELYGATTQLFTVVHAELHVRHDPARNGLDVVVMADHLQLAPGAASSAVDDIDQLRLAGLITPASSWRGLLSGHASLRQAASAFQAAGGRFQIRHVKLAWGTAALKGDGLLSLDSAARPQGILQLAVRGRLPRAGPPHGLLSALVAAAPTAAHHAVTLAFKNGISYVNASPVGLLAPVF